MSPVSRPHRICFYRTPPSLPRFQIQLQLLTPVCPPLNLPPAGTRSISFRLSTLPPGPSCYDSDSEAELPLIFRNLSRNLRRTLLTVLSLGVPFALLMTLQTVRFDSLDAYEARAERNLRVVVLHKQGLVFGLPESYVAKLAHIPGVVAACPFTW